MLSCVLLQRLLLELLSLLSDLISSDLIHEMLSAWVDTGRQLGLCLWVLALRFINDVFVEFSAG